MEWSVIALHISVDGMPVVDPVLKVNPEPGETVDGALARALRQWADELDAKPQWGELVAAIRILRLRNGV